MPRTSLHRHPPCDISVRHHQVHADMAPTLKEKQVFYADLARLDSLNDESENTLLEPGPSFLKPAATAQLNPLKRKGSASLSRTQQPFHSRTRTNNVQDPPPFTQVSPGVRPRLETPSSSCPPAPQSSQSQQPWQPSAKVNEGQRTSASPQSRRTPAQPGHSIPRPAIRPEPPEAQALPTPRRTRSERIKQKGKGLKKTRIIVPGEHQIFRGLCFFFIPNKDDHPVRKMRMEYAEAHGGLRAKVFSEEVTHVIVDERLTADSAVKEFDDGQWPLGIPAVKINWLVESMGTKVLQNSASSRFCVEGRTSTSVREEAPPVQLHTAVASCKAKRSATAAIEHDNHADHAVAQEVFEISSGQDTDSDELSTLIQEVQTQGEVPLSFLDEGDRGNQDPEYDIPDATVLSKKEGFQCMKKNIGDKTGPNAQTISVLQKMATCHDEVDDEWRTRAYRMAITVLGKEPNLIQTREEALKLIGVGPRLADKIAEIVASGSLRQLELTMSDPMLQLLGLFMGVYGAGRTQAHRWVSQGHRTLDDLRNKAELTPNQRVGVHRYDDFAQRIPREEVAQHAAIVRKAIHEVDEELELVIGGSYRRGLADSGDIDILITKKSAGNELIRTLVLDRVVPKLMHSGFLKASLATGRSDEETSKWHGASALPESRIWRRLDLLFVPGDEIGAALIYWTGNDIFNRSIRLLASRKGMRLNQHGLFKHVMRGKSREKVTDGELVESKSEKEIFRRLGVPWRPPEHRRC